MRFPPFFSKLSILILALVISVGAIFSPHTSSAAEQKKSKTSPSSAPKARSAANVQTVLAKDSGYVEFEHVEVGTFVSKNDLLLSLDTDRFRHAFESARIRAESKAQIGVASGDVRIKQAQHDSIRENLRLRRSNPAELTKAEAELDAAKSRLQLAIEADKLSELDFQRAREQLDARFIRSPIAGVVVDIPRRRGDNVQPGMVVVKVADPTRIQVTYQIPPELAAVYEVGERIKLRKPGSAEFQSATVQSIFAVPDNPDGLQQINLLINDPEKAGSSDEYELLSPTPETPGN